MKLSIYIVTHNRAATLQDAVAHILDQDFNFHSLNIIDNASNDDTQGVVAQFNDPRIKCIKSSVNMGGAGGFALAMSLFKASDDDALVLCDDDGVASPDMISRLVNACLKHDLDIGNALVLSNSDSNKLAFPFGTGYPIRNAGPIDTVETLRQLSEEGIVFDLVCLFNGAFISRKLIEKIGVVSPKMFIWGDEIDFLIRAKAAGAKIATVMDACVSHPETRINVVRAGFLGNVNVPPKARAHIAFRNLGYNSATRGKQLRGIMWAAKTALMLFVAGEFSLSMKILPYYLDGVFNTYWLEPKGKNLEKEVGDCIREQ
jgi:rhamnopyranosyl-N-acetylglucosaminyl-diphospho-decaprenol beta-1,3/1,4-galactofuranosyltransferase